MAESMEPAPLPQWTTSVSSLLRFLELNWQRMLELEQELEDKDHELADLRRARSGDYLTPVPVPLEDDEPQPSPLDMDTEVRQPPQGESWNSRTRLPPQGPGGSRTRMDRGNSTRDVTLLPQSPTGPRVPPLPSPLVAEDNTLPAPSTTPRDDQDLPNDFGREGEGPVPSPIPPVASGSGTSASRTNVARSRPSYIVEQPPNALAPPLPSASAANSQTPRGLLTPSTARTPPETDFRSDSTRREQPQSSPLPPLPTGQLPPKEREPPQDQQPQPQPPPDAAATGLSSPFLSDPEFGAGVRSPEEFGTGFQSPTEFGRGFSSPSDGLPSPGMAPPSPEVAGQHEEAPSTAATAAPYTDGVGDSVRLCFRSRTATFNQAPGKSVQYAALQEFVSREFGIPRESQVFLDKDTMLRTQQELVAAVKSGRVIDVEDRNAPTANLARVLQQRLDSLEQRRGRGQSRSRGSSSRCIGSGDRSPSWPGFGSMDSASNSPHQGDSGFTPTSYDDRYESFGHLTNNTTINNSNSNNSNNNNSNNNNNNSSSNSRRTRLEPSLPYEAPVASAVPEEGEPLIPSRPPSEVSDDDDFGQPSVIDRGPPSFDEPRIVSEDYIRFPVPSRIASEEPNEPDELRPSRWTNLEADEFEPVPSNPPGDYGEGTLTVRPETSYAGPGEAPEDRGPVPSNAPARDPNEPRDPGLLRGGFVQTSAPPEQFDPVQKFLHMGDGNTNNNYNINTYSNNNNNNNPNISNNNNNSSSSSGRNPYDYSELSPTKLAPPEGGSYWASGDRGFTSSPSAASPFSPSPGCAPPEGPPNGFESDLEPIGQGRHEPEEPLAAAQAVQIASFGRFPPPEEEMGCTASQAARFPPFPGVSAGFQDEGWSPRASVSSGYPMQMQASNSWGGKTASTIADPYANLPPRGYRPSPVSTATTSNTAQGVRYEPIANQNPYAAIRKLPEPIACNQANAPYLRPYSQAPPILRPAGIPVEVVLAKDQYMSFFGFEIEMRERDSVLRVQNIQEHGLLNRWNRTYPEQALGEGDVIVSVNGVSGSAADMKAVLINSSEARIEGLQMQTL